MDTLLRAEVDRNNIFYRCVEDSNEAIMISDKSGRMVYVNPAWTQLYGYTRDEARGHTPRLLHSGLQEPGFYREMWESLLDPKRGHWKGELVNRTKTGVLVPVLLTITAFRGEGGDILGYMGIAVDVTYKRELEAKVAHQDRLASIGLLASGLAHEVGTPLGVVRGRAEFLLMTAEDPGVRRSLETITAQIDRISKLIRSLLRVSRSFGDVQRAPVLLASVVDEVLSLIGQNLKHDNVEIRVELPDGLSALTDHGRLQQVLLNLVMNSTHAIRQALAAGQAGPHSLSIAGKRVADRVELTVADTGCGIAPEHMNRLFKPFFTTKDVGEGTGLGLAIVAQIMKELEGDISCHSVLGAGTRFTLHLPAK